MPGFSRIHFKYKFRKFSENCHSDDCFLQENFQKSYIGRFRQNPEIHARYHFVLFSLKMTI